MIISSLLWEKIHQFKQKKLSYYSLILLIIIYVFSLFAEFIANDKPLMVKYQAQYYFPIVNFVSDAQLGGEFATEADYNDNFIKTNINQNGYAIYPPIKYHYRTLARDIAVAPSAPDKNHYLGTDDEAGDVAARIIYGMRLSLNFGFVLAFFSTIIGIIYGAICGYYGGKIDLFGQRFLEIWGSMPVLFLLIILASFVQPNIFSLLGLMLLFSWTSLVGFVRAEVLKNRTMDYVRAAKALGLSDAKILMRHILPNSLNSAMAYLPFIVAGSITALTALDFIGFGLPPGEPSLGALLKQGKENIQAPWLGLSGFIVIGGILALCIFIGEGMRDVFDPKRRDS